MFVSVYMKNEKYRLQIKKSSLLAFVKAYEHMLTGALSITSKATAIMEKIDPNSDVLEFVLRHRKPRERSKRVVPAYHNNDILKDALSDYYRSRMGSPSSSLPEDQAQRRSPKASDYTDSPMKTKKRDLALDLDVIAATSGEQAAIGDSEDSTSPVVAEVNGSEATASALDSSDSENDTPLAMSDFQKKFQVRVLFIGCMRTMRDMLTTVVARWCAHIPHTQLDSPEQVVESYSCALYLSNFPYHGRLYLTRDHICFNGWRDTIYVRRRWLLFSVCAEADEALTDCNGRTGELVLGHHSDREEEYGAHRSERDRGAVVCTRFCSWLIMQLAKLLFVCAADSERRACLLCVICLPVRVCMALMHCVHVSA